MPNWRDWDQPTKRRRPNKMIVMEIFFGQLVLGILCGFLTEFLKRAK
jgi:hypothetical protein